MSDLMKDALRRFRNRKSRLARGEVEGEKVQVVKRKGILSWHLDFYVDDECQLSESESSASMAEAGFNNYVERYDLEEVE